MLRLPSDAQRLGRCLRWRIGISLTEPPPTHHPSFGISLTDPPPTHHPSFGISLTEPPLCIAAVEASAGGETACDPPSKYMQLANRIREWDPAVDTLLLTSEDPKVNEWMK
jgi:hypothetical protein